MKKKTQLLLSLLITEILVSSTFLIQHFGVQKKQVRTSQANEEEKVFLAFESTGKNVEKDISIGDEFVLPVFINTQGEKAFGVDALITFDPSLLKVIDIDPEKAGVQVTIGNIFPRFFSQEADNNKGIVKISGAAFTGTGETKPFSGTGILGNITFRTKKAGTARVHFKYKNKATDDSNVVSATDTSKDLLEKTGSATIKIVE